jgi:hypothetical protein
MATSLIKLRQLDQTELSGYIQQFMAGIPTSSGYKYDDSLFPQDSGAYTLGNPTAFWSNIYANQLFLPSGSGIYFGNQHFTTSGDSLLITGPGGTVAISSTTNYVTYVGPSGAKGEIGASGAKITGAITGAEYTVSFLLDDGSSTNYIPLPSGGIGPSGEQGPSGLSITGATTGIDITGEYFQFLFSNGTTGQVIYVPSGVQGAAGEVGGATLSFYDITGLFSGQGQPKISIDGLYDTVVGGPDINLIKGFSYKFHFENIKSLVYTNASSDIILKPTNFILYGDNDTGLYSQYINGVPQNGEGDLLTNISNSGALLLTFFDNSVENGRYIWKENPTATAQITGNDLLIDPTGIFENYEYLSDEIIIEGSGYDFYWKTRGTVRFSDNLATSYKYGFALYNADELVDPPNVQEPSAFYVLGTLNLSYAPLAGPIGPSGLQGIPGPSGPVGASGAAGATGVGISGINLIMGGGVLSGYQLVLTNGTPLGPYMIPTGGPIGPSGPTGPSGLSVTGVNQISTTGISFLLSNGSSTNTVFLPVGPTGAQGPTGEADRYYSYFDPANLRISGQVSYPTGFQTGIDGVTWANATGANRTLTTGMYVKIFGAPSLPFDDRSYSTSQKLVFAQRNYPDRYFGAQVVNFNDTDLTIYVTPQVGYWTTNGLTILGLDGNIVDLNLGSLDATGPTGVSVTGVTGYLNIDNEATGLRFFYSNNTASQVFALPDGPKGDAGATESFRISGYKWDTAVSGQNMTGNYGNADFLEFNITGSGAVQFSLHSGSINTGDVCMLLIRNSGLANPSFSFTPIEQFYFVNDVRPIFPQETLEFNIYTFIRSKDYNNHPVYYCTYAANYPALS